MQPIKKFIFPFYRARSIDVRKNLGSPRYGGYKLNAHDIIILKNNLAKKP
jgi:hypothetical protein